MAPATVLCPADARPAAGSLAYGWPGPATVVAGFCKPEDAEVFAIAAPRGPVFTRPHRDCRVLWQRTHTSIQYYKGILRY
jgi:hypothetical protein